VDFVGGVPYDKANVRTEEVGTLITSKDLADLIVAEWLDSQSDSGSLWQSSYQALELAKQDAGEKLLEEAYSIARARFDAMRRDAHC
jgi:hypothetical protein